MKAGLIDRSGKFKTDSGYVCRDSKGEFSYILAPSCRSRNDRYATLKVPIKDVYLYPLVKRFREVLALEA